MSVEVLRNLLGSRLGLELEQAPPDFLPAFRSAAARRGLSLGELAQQADATGWADWVAHLTVPETCFFRHRTQLDRLRGAVFPELDGVRPVRLWSAGCCTGEEAYTLALLAYHRGWTEFAVLATDVDDRSLAVARAGIYGAHSFREGGQEYLQARADGRFEVRAPIRSRVNFERANVLSGPRPGHHVILCRNVLIYLTPTARQKVLENLTASLLPGGVLLVSPCEVAGLSHPALERREGLLIRRQPAVAPGPAPSRPPPPAPRLAPADEPPLRRGPDLEEARRCADRGRYAEAERICREALAGGSNPLPAHFLLAQLAELQGDSAASRQRLERILELDPQAAGAWLELAQLGRAAGETARTRRLESAAREALSNLPADRLVEPYGRTAAQLLAELT